MEKAYVILAHKNPEQLERLINRLNDGYSTFFVHIDKTVPFSPFQNVDTLGGIVHFIERAASIWGSIGAVEAALNGLKAVKRHPSKFDHIILLSGQDYPIKTNEQINRFFETSEHTIFLEYLSLPNFEKWLPSDKGGMYRVNKYYFGLKPYQLFLSKSANFLGIVFPFLKRKMPYEMKPYVGSQWWSVDMYALDYILNYVERHPEYLAFHKNTFVCDELFFQMILLNSEDEKISNSIVNDNKRFMKWQTTWSTHPDILVKDDLPEILNSTALFARKFDSSKDHEIIDLIDENILFVDDTATSNINIEKINE